MPHIIRWLAGPLAAATVLLATPPAALADVTTPRYFPPGIGSPNGIPGAPPPPVLHPAVIGGTPGWQITLIALGSALAAAALALLISRAIRHRTEPRAAAPENRVAVRRQEQEVA
jgi:hypothetical protein